MGTLRVCRSNKDQAGHRSRERTAKMLQLLLIIVNPKRDAYPNLLPFAARTSFQLTRQCRLLPPRLWIERYRFWVSLSSLAGLLSGCRASPTALCREEGLDYGEGSVPWDWRTFLGGSTIALLRGPVGTGDGPCNAAGWIAGPCRGAVGGGRLLPPCIVMGRAASVGNGPLGLRPEPFPRSCLGFAMFQILFQCNSSTEYCERYCTARSSSSALLAPKNFKFPQIQLVWMSCLSVSRLSSG